MKKTTTKITITRETVRTLLESYVSTEFLRPHELKEFTISRSGSIEMTVQKVEEPETLPLDTLDPAEGFGETPQ